MKPRRMLSCMMALLLVCGLPVSVLAEEYDLAKGSITVTANEDGQYVTQADNGIVDHKEELPTVITQTITEAEPSTDNTVTIEVAAGAEADVTIQDVNIVISDSDDHSGEAAVTIEVAEDAEANVTLSDVNIDVRETGDFEEECAGEAAVQITGKGDVTIELDGENTVQSGYRRAGVEKNDADSSGSLTITDENETDGSLKATGGRHGSGIGGGSGGSGSDITITGSAEVTAKGGGDAAGIGGGSIGSGSVITITGSAEVTANGGDSGAGIGGGGNGSGSDITISGSAQVEATGGNCASGIGSGFSTVVNATGSNITVSGNAQVKAQGGNGKYDGHYSCGTGAAIGDGGYYIRGNHLEAAKGKDAEVTTDAPQGGGSYGLYVGELNEGWVATYEPGEDMDTANPGSLTYQGGIEAKDAVPVPRQEPTCTKPGHEAGYEIDGKLVAVTIPAKGHNVPGGYTPKNDATCTTLGTMTGYCIDCQTMVSIPDPNSTLKDHTFTTYTPDPDNPATCTEAGTKTAVCDVCKTATDTIPDPAKGHSMGDYAVYKAATCTEAGEERAYCDHCDHYESREIPELGHSFTDYVSDGNATYTEDGTKTAHCDHPGCTETHTIPDPGTRRPFYLVKGTDGLRLLCKEERKDGVLTITVDEDCASLTGTFSGIQALKAQGIDTIVFVTKGASSTFAISDLLAQGSWSDTYALTHDGSTVTFTVGNGTDISKILK